MKRLILSLFTLPFLLVVFITFHLFFSNVSLGQNIYWLQKQNLPDSYRNGDSVSCGGKIYFMGGYCDATPEIFDYLGQTTPGDEPEIFAPGTVSVENKNSHALEISPDGEMIIFSRYPDGTSYILTKDNDKWNGPVQSFFHGKEISFSPDGNNIFYYNNNDIYYVEKDSAVWKKPIKLNHNINSDSLTEYYPCIVKSGDMYFSRDGKWTTGRIMHSRFRNGGFEKAEDLGLPINSGGALHAWVSPDESYILFNSPRKGSYTQNDIWISFKTCAGKWTEPMNLGKNINSGADAILCPTISPDGKYLFFTKLNFKTSTGLVYWVSTNFIDSLRATAGIK
jgi:hypothetical protein